MREKINRADRTHNVEKPLGFKEPEMDKIKCKDCVFREKDKGSVKGATKGICECYPRLKPLAIIMDGKDCDYYISEKKE